MLSQTSIHFSAGIGSVTYVLCIILFVIYRIYLKYSTLLLKAPIIICWIVALTIHLYIVYFDDDIILCSIWISLHTVCTLLLISAPFDTNVAKKAVSTAAIITHIVLVFVFLMIIGTFKMRPLHAPLAPLAPIAPLAPLASHAPQVSKIG